MPTDKSIMPTQTWTRTRHWYPFPRYYLSNILFWYLPKSLLYQTCTWWWQWLNSEFAMIRPSNNGCRISFRLSEWFWHFQWLTWNFGCLKALRFDFCNRNLIIRSFGSVFFRQITLEKESQLFPLLHEKSNLCWYIRKVWPCCSLTLRGNRL